MLFEELQPDLQQWLRSVVNQGYKTEAIVDSLRKAGYESSVSSAVQEDITALRDAPEKVAVPSRNPSPWDSGVKTTSDREVQVLMTAQKPNLVLFGNLLSGEECDELIALSQPRLKRSKVVNSQSRCTVVARSLPEKNGWPPNGCGCEITLTRRQGHDTGE